MVCLKELSTLQFWRILQSVSRGGNWSSIEFSLAKNISFSSNPHISVGPYTAIRDMKPKVCFNLTSSIRSSIEVTPTTEDSSLLEMAIATTLQLCYCLINDTYSPPLLISPLPGLIISESPAMPIFSLLSLADT